MGFNCGIVGLPNAGKSTLFNALVKGAKAVTANYPFSTIDPNVGRVEVPDERLWKIAEIVKPEKVVPAVFEFVDIAGLVKGASKGEGLGNRFLSHIRAVDAIVHVVRCFADDTVVHVEGTVDPVRDAEIVDLELILKDLETVEKVMEKLKKPAKAGDEKARKKLEVLEGLREILSEGRKIRPFLGEFGEEGERIVKELSLLTAKPTIYVANVGEESITGESEDVEKLKAYALKTSSPVIKLCARIEAQLAELEENEQREFLELMGIPERGLDVLIRTGYSILDLITFFTTAGGEVKAWTVKKGTPAVTAAGKIHSDMEKGFIKAEVISYEDLVREGSLKACRDKGLVRLEGRDYVIRDGDIVYFRFSP